MARLFSRIGGSLSMLIGTLGVALCFFLVVQIRHTAEMLNREVPQSLGHALQIAQSVRQQGQATTKILQTTRERVVFLGNTIENLSIKLSDRDNTSVLITIDEDIDRQLNTAKQFVLSMQNSMRNLGSTLLLFDSMSLFGHPSVLAADREPEENPLRTVALGLRETADLLDQVTHAISKLQTGQSISPMQLINIQSTLTRVDGELVRIQTEVTTFSDEVALTEAKLMKFQSDTPAFIQYLSNVFLVFLLCFGASQLMLILFGLQWTRQSAKNRL